MEMLFSEEAEKMWNKQEAIWNREEEARKKLMDDVLDGLKEQTRSKLQGRLRIYITYHFYDSTFTRRPS